jgi:hypothetical protein
MQPNNADQQKGHTNQFPHFQPDLPINSAFNIFRPALGKTIFNFFLKNTPAVRKMHTVIR